MNILEVFFDYACPYCFRAHEYLLEVLPHYPRVDVVWRPCEAHPRPDRYGPHSDLCIQGMFYALDNNADMWVYHDLIYRSMFKNRINVESIDALADSCSEIFDRNDFYAALKGGEYVNAQRNANLYAYEQSGVLVVPSYRMNGKSLNSIEDVGVTKKQLTFFIEACLQD